MSIGMSIRDTTIQSESDENYTETSSTLEAIAGEYNVVMAPIVRVDCQQLLATIYNRNVDEMESVNPDLYYHLTYRPMISGTYDIRNIWDEKTLNDSNVSMVSFQDNLANITNAPSGMLAFVYSPYSSGTFEYPANVSMCNIAAAWEPSNLWLLLGDNRVVSSNFKWPSRNRALDQPNL